MEFELPVFPVGLTSLESDRSPADGAPRPATAIPQAQPELEPDSAVDGEVSVEEIIEEVDLRFRSEPRDRRWSADTEETIQRGWESEALEASELVEVLCQTSICRLAVIHDDEEARSEFEDKLMLVAPFHSWRLSRAGCIQQASSATLRRGLQILANDPRVPRSDSQEFDELMPRPATAELEKSASGPDSARRLFGALGRFRCDTQFAV